MTSILQIKQQQLQARKSQNVIARNLLTTLLGEATTIGKNQNRETTDSELEQVIVKFLKGAKEMLVHATDTTHNAVIQEEIKILTDLLPKQMTTDELNDLIADIITKDASININDTGKVMKFLKEQYNNQYDAKVASTLVASIWSKLTSELSAAITDILTNDKTITAKDGDAVLGMLIMSPTYSGKLDQKLVSQLVANIWKSLNV
jgi:uncharacterized protein YqeY